MLEIGNTKIGPGWREAGEGFRAEAIRRADEFAAEKGEPFKAWAVSNGNGYLYFVEAARVRPGYRGVSCFYSTDREGKE